MRMVVKREAGVGVSESGWQSWRVEGEGRRGRGEGQRTCHAGDGGVVPGELEEAGWDEGGAVAGEGVGVGVLWVWIPVSWKIDRKYLRLLRRTDGSSDVHDDGAPERKCTGAVPHLQERLVVHVEKGVAEHVRLVVGVLVRDVAGLLELRGDVVGEGFGDVADEEVG